MDDMTNEFKILQPQEIEVWYILPVIRKELAVAMKEEGLDQKTIAKLLGVTGAAISQYVNNKRGSDIEIDPDLKSVFIQSSKVIVNDSSLIFAEVQKILKLFWDSGIVCEIHKQKSWCPEDCGVCF